jgi:hypothetical protein
MSDRWWLRIVAAALLLFGGFRVAEAQAKFRSRGESTAPTGRIRQSSPPADAPATPQPVSRPRFQPAPDATHPRPVLRGGRSVEPFALWPFVQVISPLVPVVVPALQAEPGLLGGVQLDVQPWRAQVYADGAYVGLVEDFSGYYRHLELAAGPHVITIVAPDHDPLIFDVMVSPGRTITHRATLNRAPGR